MHNFNSDLTLFNPSLGVAVHEHFTDIPFLVGEIIYMGPVNLNKGKFINPGGIEVDVIPIMKSPCSTPKPTKKTNKRAKSELGFYKTRKLEIEDDRGSLPDMKTSCTSSLYDTVLQMNPERFLGRSLRTSNESFASTCTDRLSRSLGSTDSFPQRSIMGAVKQWLDKSTPFSSTDNIDNHSISTSLHETIDSVSVQDDEDIMDSVSFSDDRSLSKSFIPDIVISADQENNNAKLVLIKNRDHDVGN